MSKKLKTCLGPRCNKQFMSQNAGHRFCKTCKQKLSGKTGIREVPAATQKETRKIIPLERND